PLVRLGSIAGRCRALTMPKWTPRFLRGHPGNQILSVISVMEIPASFAPGLHASTSMRPVKSYNLGRDRSGTCCGPLIWPQPRPLKLPNCGATSFVPRSHAAPLSSWSLDLVNPDQVDVPPANGVFNQCFDNLQCPVF